ncbi:aminotransferase class-III [Beauveria bassiana ARSEF 2860]|uniref:Aminotransferase class-III n=1 Tax=Beauveria bassiana (strain ARSEF 2860) TaxID=655819 RepID=J4UGC3_BEAB2|nr:aminotransferase class-III [Beauveria bassiana ARSEF 2860]EJP61862.1 aminotransferase class-III [Beauveria bassiana ARSEF 2860]
MHTTSPPKDLAEFLLLGAPSLGLSKAYFASSGSDAVEAAMKLAVAFHRANKSPYRTHFVSRERSYHGNTIGAMCLSDNPGRTRPYEKAFDRLDVSFVKSALVNEVEAEFRRIGRQNIAAFVAETVGGSTAGCITAPKGYFEGVRRVCDEYGVLLIFDEIMCGSGRTGTYFAFESEGAVCPDIVVLGKGLSGGYLYRGRQPQSTVFAICDTEERPMCRTQKSSDSIIILRFSLERCIFVSRSQPMQYSYQLTATWSS